MSTPTQWSSIIYELQASTRHLVMPPFDPLFAASQKPVAESAHVPIDRQAMLRTVYRATELNSAGDLSLPLFKSMMAGHTTSNTGTMPLDECFTWMDMNGDGVVQLDEFVPKMEEMLASQSDSQFQTNIDAWLTELQQARTTTANKKKIGSAFNVFGTDAAGGLTLEALKAILQHPGGPGLSDENVRTLFHEA